MKRFFAIVLVAGFSCCLHAQVVDTTVCAILKDPASFNGKMVRVTGTVVAGFDQFVVKGDGCGQPVSDIWLSYPEGAKGKAGPGLTVRVQPARNFTGTVPVVTRTPVQLNSKDKVFKKFDSMLAARYQKGGMCLGCNRYAVTATLVGRLDGVADATLIRDAAGKITGFGGFGNMNAYSARLVLQSVANIAPKEIDYSASLAFTKDDTGPIWDPTAVVNASPTYVPRVGSPDPLTAARTLDKTFAVGTALGDQFSRAVNALGKEGERDSGVVIANGSGNTANAADDAKGTVDSPDGLLFICTINPNNIDSDAAARAVVFAGENIANLRTPLPDAAGVGLYYLEDRAWMTTILDVIAGRQKTLTLPGGYLIWDSTWSSADATTKAEAAVESFMGAEELLQK